MKTIATIIFIILLCACKKEESKFDLDVSVSISVKDQDGNDLLNPLTPNSILESDIKIFEMVDGVKTEVNNVNMDDPKGFTVTQKGGIYFVKLGLSSQDSYIQWSETDTDTIKGEIVQKPALTSCQKVWLNGKIVWDDYSKERFFEIIK